MQYFTKLVETARTHGFIDSSQKDRPIIHGPGYKPAPEIFWTAAESCQPFVFHGVKPLKPLSELTEDGAREVAEIDAPFPCFSIEALDGHLGWTDAMGESFFCVRYLCILVLENAPKQFSMFALCDNHHNYDEGEEPERTEYYAVESTICGHVVENCLNLIRRQKLGLENARHVIQLRGQKGKRSHRIRRIVHVSPKSLVPSISESAKTVDWTHRFQVRGHWRKHDGLGKDRSGDYKVNGYTWVKDHIKGNEALPLVTKTRYLNASGYETPQSLTNGEHL